MLRASSLGLLYISSAPRHYFLTWRNPVLRSLSTQCSTHSPHRGSVDGSRLRRHQSNVAGLKHSTDKAFTRTPEMEDFFVRKQPPYPFGRSLSPPPIPPLYGGKYRDETGFADPPAKMYRYRALRKHHSNHATTPSQRVQDVGDMVYPNEDVFDFFCIKRTPLPSQRYYAYLHIIGSTQSEADAWAAYSFVMKGFPSVLGQPPVPFPYLHRLCRLLASRYPKNHTTHIRLLQVMYNIYSHGGQLKLFEWNALLDCTVRGWKTVQLVDFDRALDLFHDMTTGNPPGFTLFPDRFPHSYDALPQPMQPDIYTYTTLLNIAVMSHSRSSIQQASEMLDASGIVPSRITHLTLLKHFTKVQHLHSIRVTLQKLSQQGHVLGLDGVNAVLWALFHCDSVDLAQKVYQVLRHALPAAESHEDDFGRLLSDNELGMLRQQLVEESISIAPLMRPNAITFHTMIQGLAYHGRFAAAIRVLSDMMGSTNTDPGASLERVDGSAVEYPTYSMSFPVFRALFLGFSRHGVPVPQEPSDSRDETSWTLKSLRAVFDLFVDMGSGSRLPRPLAYWIMVAFDKTSKHDVGLLRDVWTEMELAFQVSLGGRNNRLRTLKAILFTNGSRKYIKRHGFRKRRLHEHKSHES